MNKVERISMVKAMEFIARQLNDENDFMLWLQDGVGDGDIGYGDLRSSDEDGDLEYYIEDDEFADLMDTFLACMKRAGRKNGGGGLYCDGVVSKPKYS